jgi:hypothetical protein
MLYGLKKNNMYLYGALTNNFSQFRLRSWDTKKSPFFDTFAVEQVDIQLSFKYNKIFRVLPVSNQWLTDHTRMIFPFIYTKIESGDYGRFTIPYLISRVKKFSNLNWSYLVHFLIYLIKLLITQSRLFIVRGVLENKMATISFYPYPILNINLGKFVDLEDQILLKIMSEGCGVKANSNQNFYEYSENLNLTSEILRSESMITGMDRNTFLNKFPHNLKKNSIQIQKFLNIDYKFSGRSSWCKFLSYNILFPYNRKDNRLLFQLYNLLTNSHNHHNSNLYSLLVDGRLIDRINNSRINCYWLGEGNSISNLPISVLSSGFLGGAISYFLNSDWGFDSHLDKKINNKHDADICIVPITYFERKRMTNYKIQKPFTIVIPVSSVLEKGFTTTSLLNIGSFKKQSKKEARFSTIFLSKSLRILLSTVITLASLSFIYNPGQNLLVGNNDSE